MPGFAGPGGLTKLPPEATGVTDVAFALPWHLLAFSLCVRHMQEALRTWPWLHAGCAITSTATATCGRVPAMGGHDACCGPPQDGGHAMGPAMPGTAAGHRHGPRRAHADGSRPCQPCRGRAAMALKMQSWQPKWRRCPAGALPSRGSLLWPTSGLPAAHGRLPHACPMVRSSISAHCCRWACRQPPRRGSCQAPGTQHARPGMQRMPAGGRRQQARGHCVRPWPPHCCTGSGQACCLPPMPMAHAMPTHGCIRNANSRCRRCPISRSAEILTLQTAFGAAHESSMGRGHGRPRAEIRCRMRSGRGPQWQCRRPQCPNQPP